MFINKSIKRINYTLWMLILSTVFIVGCVTGERIHSLNPGMSQDQVMSTLGRPDGFKVQGDYTSLDYINRLISGWSWDRTDYHVILKNDKLVEYGAGEIRMRDVGGFQTLFIYNQGSVDYNVKGTIDHNVRVR